MRRRFFLLLLAYVVRGSAIASSDVPPYKNPALPTETRVADLLDRMTLEEKVGQLCQTMGWNSYDVADGRVTAPSRKFKDDLRDRHIGMLWATFRADPWTQRSLLNGLTPRLAACVANDLQRWAVDSTRLGIPLLLAEEAPHGHMAIGTTVFPTGLGMAATWSPSLLRQAGEVIAREIRLQGAHVSYGPVADLARDPRWSRVEETFGEDPQLVAELGAAMVGGLGGGAISSPQATIVTPKHFVAYGVGEGGQNGAPAMIGQRELHESFLPPFRRMIDAGALSLMTAYNSIDGVPCTANGHLLNDVLRHHWGFRGFVVSDLYGIDGLAGVHRVASTRGQAAVMALQAGVDVDLGATAFASLTDAVLNGVADMASVDSAVARVLRMKFEMGLFEHPYVDPSAADIVGCRAHRDVALQMARASITLLKNADGVLPLSPGARVLVCGPNADNCYNQLGDYTAPQTDESVTTILEGLRSALPDAQVEYVKGCAVRDTTADNIVEAVEAALRCDVVVACVGGSSARDFKTSYDATGAAETSAEARSETLADMECGEGFDRATLGLLGRQQQLLTALKQTGKPLVVVYVEGRPLDKLWAAHNADALLTAYYPGQEGGTAVADVLTGRYNPAGRLPISVPAHVGQLPVYYNKRRPAAHDYADMTSAPLYPFGHGLSYTTFGYGPVSVQRVGPRSYRLTLSVTNTGDRDGEEVVQLYLRHEQSPTVQPPMQLKLFQRVFIARGESRSIEFALDDSHLSVVGPDMRPTVPTGQVTVMIGASSADIRQRIALTIE